VISLQIAIHGIAHGWVEHEIGVQANRRPKAVKISCDEVWREISNYLEDEVSAGLRTRMDQHFSGCKRCTAVLVGTRNVVRLVGDAAVLDLLTAVGDSPRSET
jgi:hypothetical protein